MRNVNTITDNDIYISKSVTKLKYSTHIRGYILLDHMFCNTT